MTDDFRLLMLGAMYENGGNTTHRFLDGHPEMFVYPFESQIGTRLVVDPLSSVFPVKYRWPVFALDATPDEDYHAIIDEECKVRARTPQVSKFRHVAFDFSDDERRDHYRRYVGSSGRTRGGNVAAFFRATFDAWKDYRRTGSAARVCRLQSDHRRRRRQDPARPARRTRAARRAQSLVGIRRHQEAARCPSRCRTTCSAGRSISTTPCSSSACSPVASTSCGSRTCWPIRSRAAPGLHRPRRRGG